MTNNTPDYNDNLYFEKKMDCKNCPYTDEYCASGDCERNNNLTEQWKKGELSCGWYYIKIADIVFIDFFEGKVWKNKKDKYIDKVLAPVPSYEEWKASYNCMFENEVLRLKNAQLKDLLKEIRLMMSIERDFASGHFEKSKLTELLTKIDEVLK